MKTYYLWATLLGISSGRMLIADLANGGCKVSALGSGGNTHLDGEASTLFSLRIETKEDRGATLDRIRNALTGNQAMWHSLVIYEEGASCQWVGSNIVLPKREEPKPAEPTTTPASRFDRLNEASSEGAKE